MVDAMDAIQNWRIEDVFKTPDGDLRFFGHMGVDSIEEEGDCVRMSLSVRRELTNGHLTCQGGALYALCDMACAAYMRIKVGSEVTLSGTINFYAPGRLGDRLTAVCTPRRVGRTICAVFCEVKNQDGKLIADSLQSFYRIYGE